MRYQNSSSSKKKYFKKNAAHFICYREEKRRRRSPVMKRMAVSPNLYNDEKPTEEVTQRRQNILVIIVLVLLALGIAVGMIVYLSGVSQSTEQSPVTTPTSNPDMSLSKEQEAITSSIELILKRKRKWTNARLDTAEAVIGVILSNLEIRNSYLGSLFDVKIQAMTIDLLAALAMDNELTGDVWSRGKLAQYVGGIQALCEEPKDFFSFNLINLLNHHLNQSLDYFRANRVALSWMALVLCWEGEDFASDYEQIFGDTENFVSGIDEASMVTMACLCLNNTETRKYAEGSTEYVLQHLQEDDDLNAFSLGLAAQALISTKNSTYQELIENTTSRLINMLDIPRVMKYGPAVSQILPPLTGKSYLDIGLIECPVTIWVTISMEDNVITNTTGQWNASVSQGATLYMVIQKLERQDPTFSFESKPTHLGPMITAINNIAADASSMFWKTLKAPNESANKGIDDIVPVNGEHFIFRLIEGSHNWCGYGGR